MFRIAGCRQPAIRAGALRPMLCKSSLAPLASKHHHAAHMRRLQPRPCLGRAASLRPDASGRKDFPTDWFCRTLALHALPLRTRETKRPRDLRPEGVRVGSGDRGGRSPRESDRDYAWRYRLRSPIRRSSCFAQSRTSALRRVGHSANRIALTKFGFMENLVSKKRRRGEGRGQYAPFFRCATFF